MDENTRRYYLDVMGVQCWQLNTTEDGQAEAGQAVSTEPPVQGSSTTTTDLMFVFFAPDSHDDSNDNNTDKVCSGEANTLFAKMLAAINVAIEDVYITSLLKHHVPASHRVTEDEMQHCLTYLQQKIQLIQPRQLIVLGEAAVHCLLQKNMPLDELRNLNAVSQFTIASLPVFVSYSPHELLQQPANKRKAWADLQQLQKILAS
ncbi:uracil-DNA glycosylase [Cardiobacterium sp. AH-315-I02]|nr:uracil-DNA glycosylase [Cardiobacterium sp. AH-315-I02]